MRRLLQLLGCGFLAWCGTAQAGPRVYAPVAVRGPRVHLGDLVSGLSEATGAADIGPSPAFEGTRIVPRDEVLAALAERGEALGRTLPDGYRVRRKLRTVTAGELDSAVGDALRDSLPRGVTLSRVLGRDVKAPDGWTDVRCTIPHPPHRTGGLTTTATVVLSAGGEPVWTLSVPVELELSQDAVPFDVPRGTPVSFVVRRGLVELRAAATVTADADVGDIAPVTVLPSGRALAARLEDARTAVFVERP